MSPSAHRDQKGPVAIVKDWLAECSGPATDVAGLLWTCVGVPEYRTRRSGAPGSPADVTIVWPR